ncbi:MAG: dCTP deaminase [Nitrososphaerota archaeon]|nr:dCTP deaminase [Nitrososphaerota archaeon]MDG7048506.1 dCTP deaminase [Nitrososphaerota archaeon]
MILSDIEIKKRVLSGEIGIEPFLLDSLSPNGIDLRIGDKVVDMSNELEYSMDKGFMSRPDTFYLMSTAERITLPLNVVGLIFLKSTWARMGILIPPTVVDAGYTGVLSLIIRMGPRPIKLEKGLKIWHFLMQESYESTGYQGKYQNSDGLKRAILPDRP